MQKKIKDGKLCVLVSPGHGAGWYSWHHVEELLFDPIVVDMVLEGADSSKIEEYCEETYGINSYLGADQLVVEYVDTNDKFRIDEYDGFETLMRMQDYQWFQA